MKKTTVLVVAVLLAIPAAGCHMELVRETNPFENIESVAIAPFEWYAGLKTPVESLQTMIKEPGEIMASELAKYEGFSVVRPATVERVMEEMKIDMKKPGAALKLAEELEVDAVIFGEITDCQPYSNPRMGVMVRMFTTAKYNVENIDWDKMMRRGRHIEFSSDISERPIIAFERIFDSGVKATRDRVYRYASYHETADRALGRDAFVKILRNYFQYISFEVINEIIHTEQARQGWFEEDEEEYISPLGED